MIDRPMSAFLALFVVSGAIRADAMQPQAGSFAFTCAAFPAGLSETDLIARYGRENVTSAPVFGSDDGPQDGTVLFSGTEGARLGQPAGPRGCVVRIHFQPRYDGTEEFALVRQVRSGREYSSGHPALQKLNPRVAGIWVAYPLR